MIKRILLMGFLSQFFFLAALMAQSDRATMTGTVKDSSGAIIPGVSVTATNLQTKVKTSATTSDLGLYRILNLAVGQYSVLFVKGGFQPLDQTGITLTISQVAEIDVTLKVSAVTQTI